MQWIPRTTRYLVGPIVLLLFATTTVAAGQDLTATVDVDAVEPNDAQVLLERPAHLTTGDVTLPVALAQLHQSAGVPIVFSESFVPTDVQVRCECMTVTVREALDQLLGDTDLRYAELRSQVLIEPRPQPAPPSRKIQLAGAGTTSLPLVDRTMHLNGGGGGWSDRTAAGEREGSITGRVVDAQTERPLSGAQVFVPDTGAGTLTNAEGEFTLSDVPAGEVTVRVQMIGYAPGNQTVSVVAGETVAVNFGLREQALGLDEIVVTGTAGQARRREVGNTISQIDVASVSEPVTTVDNLLQGRSTAMTVNPGSATMGGGAAIRLRGNASLTLSNQPLIYVDGVRQGAEAYPTPTSEGVFYARTHATASPLNDINPNDIERIEIVKGAAATTLYGSEAAAGVIQIFTKRGTTGGAPSWTYQTNQRFDRVQQFGSDERPFINMEPFLKTAYGQQHNLSVSGGAQGARYYISGMFEDGDGVHPNDHERRAGLRGNVSIQPTENLTLDWNTAYTDHDMSITHVGNNLFGLQFNAYRSPNNTVGSADPDVIAQLLDAMILQENNRFNTGLTATWAPTTRLTNRLTLGLDRTSAEVQHVTPYDYILFSEGYIDERRWVTELISLDYVGSYSFPLASDLNSRFSWGVQNNTTAESSLTGFGRGLPGPGEHTLSSTAVRQTFSDGSRIIDAGIFVENMFDFADRYFLTAGVRVDGNSTFGADLGLQAYPKVSGSWVVSDEPFWPEGSGQFRLRGAYGQAGRAPGPFDATRTWRPMSFAGRSAFRPDNIGARDLGPERSQEIEFGFEGNLLNDRLAVNFTSYFQETTDALFAVPQLASQGFAGTQLRNVGALTNRGVEFVVDGSIIQRQNFSWNVGASLSTNHSQVTDTGDHEYHTIVVGQPAPVLRGTRVLNADEFAEPELERDAFLGPRQPTRIIGVNTTIGLPHGIELSGRGEYQGGHWIGLGQGNMVNRGAGSPHCDPSRSGAYGHVEYFDYPNGDLSHVNALDRARCYRETLVSDIWNGRGDFFKIRDVTVRLPVNFAVPLANAADLALSMRNIRIWTHSDFQIFDPEMGTSISALNQGPPNELTPAPMRATASLRITF